MDADRTPTVHDVARRAGVSTATVSRALSGNGPVSDSTRARVVQAASDLAYVVSSDASSLASGRTRNIGAVVSRESIMSDVWGAGCDSRSNVVEVCVRRLRRKLGGDAPIETVRNGGYRIAA